MLEYLAKGDLLTKMIDIHDQGKGLQGGKRLKGNPPPELAIICPYGPWKKYNIALRMTADSNGSELTDILISHFLSVGRMESTRCLIQSNARAIPRTRRYVDRCR